MTMRKFGRGEIIPEPDDNQKVAGSKEWTEQDDEALREENDDGGS